MKNKSIIKNILLILLLLISLIVFVYNFIEILKWNKDNEHTKEEVNTIQKEVSIIENNSGQAINSNNKDKGDIYWDYVNMNLINVDFSSLKKKNKDTKGWIQVNGTNINYPFVQTSDNKYYLTHSFDKKYNTAGWVFMDFRNNPNDYDKNTIIYAHARRDRTMFGSLKNIFTNDWYKDTDNHIIKLSTEKENTLWQVFSVYHINTETYYITTDFNNDNDFKKFADTLKKRSLFKFNATVDKEDKILTLSTCYNSKEKVVLHAKLIKKETRN